MSIKYLGAMRGKMIENWGGIREYLKKLSMQLKITQAADYLEF